MEHDKRLDGTEQAKLEEAGRKVLAGMYPHIWPGCEILQMRYENFVLDRYLGLDTKIVLPNLGCYYIQEKTLKWTMRKYKTVTVEYYNDTKTRIMGDWHHLACQYYFCGYIDHTLTYFYPWILLKWAEVVECSLRGEIKWSRPIPVPGTNSSFICTPMEKIPDKCIYLYSPPIPKEVQNAIHTD